MNLMPFSTGLQWTWEDDHRKQKEWKLPVNSTDFPEAAYLWNQLAEEGYLTSYGSPGTNFLMSAGHYEDLFRFSHLTPVVYPPFIKGISGKFTHELQRAMVW